MATPAEIDATPEAYGEKQKATPSSEGVMDNLSSAATRDVAKARECLKTGYENALSQLEMQYEMARAQLTAKYTDLDGKLRAVEETIASYKSNAIAAMDAFLSECKGATVTAVELVPMLAVPEEPLEPPAPVARLVHKRAPLVPTGLVIATVAGSLAVGMVGFGLMLMG